MDRNSRLLHFAMTAIVSFVVYGYAQLPLYAAQHLQFREFPDGDIQDVSVAHGLLSQTFVSEPPLNKNGLAYALCGEKYLSFVVGSGHFVQAFNYDNGPDYFSKDEGLARYIGENGLIGFVDRKLNIIIPAKYTIAFPFVNGRAKAFFQENGAMEQGWVTKDGRFMISSGYTDKSFTGANWVAIYLDHEHVLQGRVSDTEIRNALEKTQGAWIKLQQVDRRRAVFALFKTLKSYAGDSGEGRDGFFHLPFDGIDYCVSWNMEVGEAPCGPIPAN